MKGKGPGESPRLVLKSGREKSLLRRHPWIFSGAVDQIEDSAQSGDTVRVLSARGEFVALAAWSPKSNICARVWDWREDTRIDAGFFASAIARAASSRNFSGDDEKTVAGRLVHAESDGLPGLIVDRYGPVAVVQLLTAGTFRWREEIADAIAAITGIDAVYERSDADVLALEGLAPRVGLLRGHLDSTTVDIVEAGLTFRVDVQHGHKTGFYLDQRENRASVGALCRDRDVLNCFAYTGGFSLHALSGGARSVLSIESSKAALDAARNHVLLNRFDPARCEWEPADVFTALRALRDQGRQFDLIVLDPPKFAPTAATAERAARGYKDINLLAIKILRPGGLLATFSCSGGVSADLFCKIVAGAALDAGAFARVLRQFHAAPDHPVSLAFPEGEYLKGLLVEKQ
ncbi:MAG: class I SAM-dependent rRNA methyltransferase [Burkholderiales bacterium]